MVATVVGVSTTATWPGSAGLPFTINWPGASAGQLVILPITARMTATAIPTTSGYVLKSTDDGGGTNISGEIQAKIAGSSEAAPTVTSGIVNTQPTGAIAIVIDGWSGDLADVVVTQDAGASSNPVCPAGTAPADGCLVLRGVFVADDNLASSGLTPVFNELSIQGSGASMGWWSETADTGAVGTAALPLTSGSDGWMSFTVVIPPSGDEPEPETATLDATLPALTGALTAEALATATLAAALPALAGALTAGASASAAVATTLPAVTGSLVATAHATAEVAATLPTMAGSLTAQAHAEASLAGALPLLAGAFTVAVEGTASATLTATFPAFAGALTAQASASAPLAAAFPIPAGAFVAAVESGPARNLQIRVGQPQTRWRPGQPETRWWLGPPDTRWDLGLPEV